MIEDKIMTFAGMVGGFAKYELDQEGERMCNLLFQKAPPTVSCRFPKKEFANFYKALKAFLPGLFLNEEFNFHDDLKCNKGIKTGYESSPFSYIHEICLTGLNVPVLGEDCALRMMIPQSNPGSALFLTLSTSNDYQLGCLDDLVEVIGHAHLPHVAGIRKIRFKEVLRHDENGNEVSEDKCYYGLDPKRLPTTVHLYQQAQEVLNLSEKLIKTRIDQLNVFRETDPDRYDSLMFRLPLAASYFLTKAKED